MPNKKNIEINTVDGYQGREKEIILISHKYNMPPYLCGIKIHKKDEFLLSYSLDGYSVVFDFPVNDALKEDQKIMFNKLHSLVVSYGGLVYLAKDSNISSGDFIKMYGDRIKSFLDIKHKYDPNDLFQSNMYRRLILNN